IVAVYGVQHGCGVAELGNPLGRHEGRGLHARNAGSEQTSHQAHLGIRGDCVGDVLQPIAGGDVRPRHPAHRGFFSVGEAGQNIAQTSALMGTMGSTATTSHSIEPERSAITTALIHATAPVTNAVAPTSEASTPRVPVPSVFVPSSS